VLNETLDGTSFSVQKLGKPVLLPASLHGKGHRLSLRGEYDRSMHEDVLLENIMQVFVSVRM
jgi:hypothetical protein